MHSCSVYQKKNEWNTIYGSKTGTCKATNYIYDSTPRLCLFSSNNQDKTEEKLTHILLGLFLLSLLSF
jgi:hypothetical protein